MSFRDDLAEDPVRSLSLRDAIVVEPTTSLQDAVGLMREKSLGCAVIVDAAGKVSGIFTEQSLLEALAQSESLDGRPVSDFADPGFLVVSLSDPVSKIWNAVVHDGLRFVCVTDDENKLVGVTGQRGLAEYMAEYFPQQILVQRLGSTPWMQQREGA